ncbi:chromosome segregation protein SMC [Shewanella gelidii]|uniref:Chromosome partition protein Smc n=1 Tax=Shewanella gelidii TaxID=1642821 RepID=A0A917JTW7_9GAMM|nr:chromosome segregation protein SMC [Shewanella gelidii]MCL1098354.1 chromosome segregation protein SMC [Shewanella gelidii]GGI84586.1 chromosome partition protein Smc [Shewanella gelidii]
MKLKQIKLAGFKSFVDPTKIPFVKELSAIIGPNGCGKSNVIDAVRWVLGESSAKHLRGDSMLDVVFNGSSARKPVSVASVELLFDNSLGRFGGQYASYTDIHVKRQISRDGDSNYYLNGQKCRRKDVTELFMGTGLGARSYAIIGQGTISRLIESKPQELRVFIEEAAGISRYKERRRDTENRIRHTRENLERLGDIRQELASQLEKLAKQSQTAIKYRELKQTERESSALLHVLKQHELQTAANGLSQQITGLERTAETLRIDVEANNAQRNVYRESMLQLVDEEHAIREQYYDANTKIAALEQRIKEAKSRATETNQAQQKLAREIKNKQQELDVLLGELQNETQQFNQGQANIKSQHHIVQGLVDVAQEHQLEFNDISVLKKESELHTTNLRHELALTEQRLLSHEQTLARLISSQAQYQQQVSQTTAAEELAGIEKTKREIAALQNQLAELEEQILEVSAQQGEERERVASHQTHYQEALQQQARLQGQIKTLEGLLRPHQQRNMVWQQLEIQTGWEQATQLLLGQILYQPMVQESPDTEHQPKLGFQVVPALAHQRLGNQVSAPPFHCELNLLPWLHGVQWCESLELAQEQLQTLEMNQCIVTADGYMLGHGFQISCVDGSQSVLAIQHELTELSEQCVEMKQQVLQWHERLQQSQASVQQIEHQLESLNRQKVVVNTEIARRQTNLNMAIQASKSQKIQQDKLKKQSQENEQEILDYQNLLGEGKQKVLGCRTLLSEAEEQGSAFSARFELAQSHHQHAQSELQAEKQKLNVLEKQQGSLHTKLQLTEQKVALLNKRITELVNEQKNLNQKLLHLESQSPVSNESQAERLQSLLSSRLKYQQHLEKNRQEQQALQEIIDTSGLQHDQQLDKIQQLNDGISELKLNREGLNGQLASLAQQAQEQGVALERYSTESIQSHDSARVQERLDKTRRSIARLGAINLAAIEEFEQQQTRKTYLDNQDSDLCQALSSLEDAIRKIDRETRSRFKQTFDEVNKGLSQLFPKVFGGGSAYLALTEADMLEAGVTIMARPPGKKNSTIHLLSGGEKALTALSLVFAIFRLNPAPFCMLDEVDAPLDDANVERFCRLLKEMSQSVQFVYISHNKVTMELADQLIGVTMHEPGVSRIVAVDLDEAVALADAV